MNQRIKELAKQAGFVLIRDEYLFTEMMGKFAELIVRECASIAGKAEYSDTWFVPVEDTIKQHFGVGE